MLVILYDQLRPRKFAYEDPRAKGILGTLNGILVVIVLSLVGLLWQGYDPHVHELGRKPGTDVFRPLSPEHPEDETIPGLPIARPEDRIYFGNAENVGRKLGAMINATSPRVVLLDCSAVPDFEYTALKMLVTAEAKLYEEGTEIWLAALNPEALELVKRTPLAERLGRERLFFTVEQAVAAFEARPAGY